MPIIEDGDDVRVEYSIPKDIKDNIPDYFYYAMAGELVSIFGLHILQKQSYKEDEWYDLETITNGWYEAFKAACRKLDMDWLLEYRNQLEWYDSDIFDGEIEKEIVEKFCKHNHMEDHANCYYKYLLSKD